MTWYRSLYWRIALGVIGFLAAMLIVQAMLFVWAVSQSGRSLPGQSPARFSVTIALDLSSALERDPSTDLTRYVHDQYAQYTHPFFVMLADGKVITSGSSTVAEPLLAVGYVRGTSALFRTLSFEPASTTPRVSPSSGAKAAT